MQSSIDADNEIFFNVFAGFDFLFSDAMDRVSEFDKK
jgi:hypothetical protein